MKVGERSHFQDDECRTFAFSKQTRIEFCYTIHTRETAALPGMVRQYRNGTVVCQQNKRIRCRGCTNKMTNSEKCSDKKEGRQDGFRAVYH